MGLSLLIRRPVGIVVILQLGTVAKAQVMFVPIGKDRTLLVLVAVIIVPLVLLAIPVVAMAGHPIWYILLRLGRIAALARWPLP